MTKLAKEIYPNVQPGTTVRVHQVIREKNIKGEEKERIQIFEGMVLARKGGEGVNATITVRKNSKGYGVEKIFPLHSPNVANIEVTKKAKVRRSKLYFTRTQKHKFKEVQM
jgi:large subunit ribosomal protein L19